MNVSGVKFQWLVRKSLHLQRVHPFTRSRVYHQPHANGRKNPSQTKSHPIRDPSLSGPLLAPGIITQLHHASQEGARVDSVEWGRRRGRNDTRETIKRWHERRGIRVGILGSNKRITDSIEQDLSLPKSMIGRLAKGVLPANTQIQRDALLALHKSATVFVSYIASK